MFGSWPLDCYLLTDGIELLTDHCLVAKVDTKFVGTVALEPYGRSGLLRSLAVAPDYRERSLGRSFGAWSPVMRTYESLRMVE